MVCMLEQKQLPSQGGSAYTFVIAWFALNKIYTTKCLGRTSMEYYFEYKNEEKC